MIYGNGYLVYLRLFTQGKISKNNRISLIDSDLEFFVNDDGSLDWANVFTKKTLLKRNVDYKLENIPPKEVLFRKKWYVSYCEKD